MSYFFKGMTDKNMDHVLILIADLSTYPNIFKQTHKTTNLNSAHNFTWPFLEFSYQNAKTIKILHFCEHHLSTMNLKH